jgi:hypothetical protein
MIAECVTFCDIVWSLLCSRRRICQLSARVETMDRLCLSRMARTFPLPEFYNITIGLIPTAAVVALSESTTQTDFGGGDGWVMSHDHTMHVLSPPRENERWVTWSGRALHVPLAVLPLAVLPLAVQPEGLEAPLLREMGPFLLREEKRLRRWLS